MCHCATSPPPQKKKIVFTCVLVIVWDGKGSSIPGNYFEEYIVVTTLELQRFCALKCINMIYSSKLDLCVLSFATKMLHMYS